MLKCFPTKLRRHTFSFPNSVETVYIHPSPVFCIHSVVCLTTGPLPLPQQVLYTVRSSASSFNFRYPRFSFRSSSSCLHLIPRLSVTFIIPSTSLLITCFRRNFLRQDVINPVSLPSTYYIQDTITLRN